MFFGNVGFNNYVPSMPYQTGPFAPMAGYAAPSIFAGGMQNRGFVEQDPRMNPTDPTTASSNNQLLNAAATAASQMYGIAPEAALQILSFRIAALRKATKLDSKPSAEDANKLVQFVGNYLQMNGGQIPQNYQQYVEGVKNVAAADMASQGKPFLSNAAFNPYDLSPGAIGAVARASRSALNSGMMA